MDDFPPAHPVWPVLCALISALERKHPGLIDTLIEDLNDEVAWSMVRKLRGPAASDTLTINLRQGNAWVLACKVLVESRLLRRPGKKSKKGWGKH